MVTVNTERQKMLDQHQDEAKEEAGKVTTLEEELRGLRGRCAELEREKRRVGEEQGAKWGQRVSELESRLSQTQEEAEKGVEQARRKQEEAEKRAELAKSKAESDIASAREEFERQLLAKEREREAETAQVVTRMADKHSQERASLSSRLEADSSSQKQLLQEAAEKHSGELATAKKELLSVRAVAQEAKDQLLAEREKVGRLEAGLREAQAGQERAERLEGELREAQESKGEVERRLREVQSQLRGGAQGEGKDAELRVLKERVKEQEEVARKQTTSITR